MATISKPAKLSAKFLEKTFGNDYYLAIVYANSTKTKTFTSRLDPKYTNVEYNKKVDEYMNENKQVDSIIEEYLKQISGFNTLPEDKKSKVWTKAYESGHSNGYGRIYQELLELVDLIK